VACGLVKSFRPIAETAVWDRARRRAHYRVEFWLRAACGRRTLWAENAAHLDGLDRWVRGGSPEVALPKWMKVVKHRAAVARAVARLRTRLAEAGR
jgi:hypothetical protein